MRINSVSNVKCFCKNKNVLWLQSMEWHFVLHPAYKEVFFFFITGLRTVRRTSSSLQRDWGRRLSEVLILQFRVKKYTLYNRVFVTPNAEICSFWQP